MHSLRPRRAKTQACVVEERASVRTFAGGEELEEVEADGEHVALGGPEGVADGAQGAAVARVTATRRGAHGG